MESFLSEIIKANGPWVGLVAFLVWQTWIREKRMSAALDAQHAQAMALIETTTEERAEATGVIRRNTRVLEALPDYLRKAADDETPQPPTRREQGRTPLPGYPGATA